MRLLFVDRFFALSGRALLACALSVCGTALAVADEPRDRSLSGAAHDFKLYVTAPTRWDGNDWLFLGASVAAVGIAHRYDDDVRRHFFGANETAALAQNSRDLDDAAPAAAAFIGTWALGVVTSDMHGRREAWSMAEAAAFSMATGLAMKFVAGRERPNETSDSNRWRAGGDSFPSLHTSAAFAIGAVMAESGNDDYRWLRRSLGYGLGVATSYLRTKHNAHWLSDTVAGAAIGIASARFVVGRDSATTHRANVWVTPVEDGAMLSYSIALR